MHQRTIMKLIIFLTSLFIYITYENHFSITSFQQQQTQQQPFIIQSFFDNLTKQVIQPLHTKTQCISMNYHEANHTSEIIIQFCNLTKPFYHHLYFNRYKHNNIQSLFNHSLTTIPNQVVCNV